MLLGHINKAQRRIQKVTFKMDEIKNVWDEVGQVSWRENVWAEVEGWV